jgi:hypothetical protein
MTSELGNAQSDSRGLLTLVRSNSALVSDALRYGAARLLQRATTRTLVAAMKTGARATATILYALLGLLALGCSRSS